MTGRTELPAQVLESAPAAVVHSSDVIIVREGASGAAIPRDVYVSAPLILVVIEGRRTISCGTRAISAVDGEALFATPGAYRIAPDGDRSQALWMFFESDFLAAFVQRHPDACAVACPTVDERAFNIRRTPFFEACLRSLPPFVASDDRPSRLLVQHKLDEIVLSLIDADPRVIPQLRYAARQERTLLRYVESQRASRCPVTELARGVGQSLSTFKRRFRDATGSSPAAWLRRKRLDRARVLLETTNRSVTDVAFEVGFASVSHFVHAFRRQHGTTPRGVRKMRNSGAA